MGEILTSQQLLHNSYHLAIRSSLLAIQSTLSLQQTMLRSDDSTFADIKSAIASQNANLQRFTKIIAETFPKISSFKPPPPQPKSTPSATVPAGSPPPTTLTALKPSFPPPTTTSTTHLPTTPSSPILSFHQTPPAQCSTLAAGKVAAKETDSSVALDSDLAVVNASEASEQQKPVFGAGLNQPPPLFWGSTASQPPFSRTVGLHASFAEAKAHNVVFRKMHERNWALSVTIKNDDKIKSKEFCGEDYICFLRGLFACEIMMVESKVLIFDPGGNIEFACLFVVRLYGYAQLNHNLGSTISTPVPPLYDLEDKVIFKGSVMIRMQLEPHHS